MSDKAIKTTIPDDPFPSPYMSEPRGYALSGKIMLSAIIILFAVVIIMVCLHIYARWYILRARRRQIRRARRRTHLVFYIEPNNPSSIIPIPNRGLDPMVLNSLPIFIFEKKSVAEDHEAVEETHENSLNNKVEEKEEEEEAVLECAVCLSEFEDGEKVRPLPTCNHVFHVDCIDMWFHSHSTCPICRAPVEASDFTAAALGNKPEAAAGRFFVWGGHEPSQQISQFQQRTHDLANVNNSSTTSDDNDASQEHECVGTPVAAPSSSRRIKGLEFVGVSIELPGNRLGSFVDESGPSQVAKSPTSRILSLKRILSREKKSPLNSPSGVGPSCVDSAGEFDLELGRVDSASHPSPVPTPR